jgi:cation transport ATPase
VVGPRAGGEGGEGIDDAPSLLADAIEFPRRTKIRQGLFRVFANNVPGNPLAALGCLSPLVAGAALSSASVVGRRFRSAAGAHSKWYHLSIGL